MKDDSSALHARHIAFQIVSQLPEDVALAVYVLEYAKALLLQPLITDAAKDAATAPVAPVVPIRLVQAEQH